LRDIIKFGISKKLIITTGLNFTRKTLKEPEPYTVIVARTVIKERKIPSVVK